MPLRLKLTLPVVRGLRSYSTNKRFVPVDSLQFSQRQDIDGFALDRPIVLQNYFGGIPALSTWFKPSAIDEGFHELDKAHLERYSSTIVPLELTRSTLGVEHSQTSSFERFEAPLSLLIASIIGPQDLSTRLYLAQCPLEDLPTELKADIPTPRIISCVGRGDIYSSSLWMGRPPTRTPLHRDPNPNLFVQLAGRKVVRLMTPVAGKDLYMRVRAGGHANMRDEEMMVGEENERLEDAVWNDGLTANNGVEGWEVTLKSADGLFIPVGWWHSVRGIGIGVNASVSLRNPKVVYFDC